MDKKSFVFFSYFYPLLLLKILCPVISILSESFLFVKALAHSHAPTTHTHTHSLTPTRTHSHSLTYLDTNSFPPSPKSRRIFTLKVHKLQRNLNLLLPTSTLPLSPPSLPLSLSFILSSSHFPPMGDDGGGCNQKSFSCFAIVDQTPHSHFLFLSLSLSPSLSPSLSLAVCENLASQGLICFVGQRVICWVCAALLAFSRCCCSYCCCCCYWSCRCCRCCC